MVALPDRQFMSAAAYLEWEPTKEGRYEYWDGEVVAMSGGTRTHNRISLNFSKLIDDALLESRSERLRQRSCEVYIADVKVQVSS